MQYSLRFSQLIDQMLVGWTRQLSQAFQADQKAVLAAVQSKLAQVQQMAHLPSPPQQSVETKIDIGQQHVEINPAYPNMVCVSQYNPVTIYNTPASSAPAQTTTADTTTAQMTSSPEQKSGVSTGTAVVASLLSPGVVMTVGGLRITISTILITIHGKTPTLLAEAWSHATCVSRNHVLQDRKD